MILYRVPAPELNTDSSEIEAFLTSTGIQILKSIDNIPGEGRSLHVSITRKRAYPPEHLIEEVIRHFFVSGKIDVYCTLSPKSPPMFTVHLFRDMLPVKLNGEKKLENISSMTIH